MHSPPFSFLFSSHALFGMLDLFYRLLTVFGLSHSRHLSRVSCNFKQSQWWKRTQMCLTPHIFSFPQTLMWSRTTARHSLPETPQILRACQQCQPGVNRYFCAPLKRNQISLKPKTVINHRKHLLTGTGNKVISSLLSIKIERNISYAQVINVIAWKNNI